MTNSDCFKSGILLIGIDGKEIYPGFSTPLVHQLKKDDESVNVDISYENNQLIIRRNDQSTVLFRRPAYCPFTELYSQNRSVILDRASNSNTISIGVVVVFETSDFRVLITRRAGHMRTFPWCWVCPGGGIEQNETLAQAGIRELSEEVGIEITETEPETPRILAVWESSFPIKLDRGLPQRHHVVVYLRIKSSRKSDDIPVKIDTKEVDAYAWISYEQIEYISYQKDSFVNSKVFNAYMQTIGMSQLPLDLLVRTNPDVKEYLTNGTRFALEQLLASKRHEENNVGVALIR